MIRVVDGPHEVLVPVAAHHALNQLCVIAGEKKLADLCRVLADNVSNGCLKRRHVLLDCLRVGRRRVFLSTGRNDNHVHLLRASGKITTQIRLQRLFEYALVFGLDSLDIGIAPANENIIKGALFSTCAFHCCVEGVAVTREWTTCNLNQSLLEIARGFRLEIGDQVSHESLVELRAKRINLNRILLGQGSDKSLLVRAKSLHCFANGFDVYLHVEIARLHGSIPKRCLSRRSEALRRSVPRGCTVVLLRRRGILLWRWGLRSPLLLRRWRLAPALLLRWWCAVLGLWRRSTPTSLLIVLSLWRRS
ncbi:unnamed protein product [Periconia digitata]|uniref:Uncharacterized protein n=1 Tax=Periconia digitata TaxID=1303443 RepID=A0A9W4US32_9PLEO|nr:unnamed protein product [Periconia digitata]